MNSSTPSILGSYDANSTSFDNNYSIIPVILTSMTNYNMSIQMDFTDANFTENSTAQNGSNLFTSFSTQTLIECNLRNFIISAMLGIICILGLAGNMMIKYTLWPQVTNNATSFLIIVLAFHDNIIILVHLFAKTIVDACKYTGTGSSFVNSWIKYSYYTYSIAQWSQMNGAWTILLVSFTRYIALCKPYNVGKYCTWKKACLQNLIVLVTVTSYFIPSFMRVKTILPFKGRYKLVYHNFATTTAAFVYDYPLFYTLMYVLPFTSLITTTILQIKKLHEVNTRKKLIMTQKKKNERNITVALVIVALVFMFCQTWEPIRRLVGLTKDPMSPCSKAYYYVSHTKSFFVTLNSSVNFLIYMCCGQGFKRQFTSRMACYRQAHNIAGTGSNTTSSSNGTRKGLVQNKSISQSTNSTSVSGEHKIGPEGKMKEIPLRSIKEEITSTENKVASPEHKEEALG